MKSVMIFSLLMQIAIFKGVISVNTTAKKDETLLKQVKFVMSNPLKFIRSLFQQHKHSSSGHNHLSSHIRRERENVLQDRIYEDFLLLKKPARLKCFESEVKNEDKSSVLWTKDGKSISISRERNIDSHGDLVLDNVQVSDMATFTCKVAGYGVSTHHVNVISLPKIRIEVKSRYKTNHCESSTKSSFRKSIFALIDGKICGKKSCKMRQVDITCQNFKDKTDEFEFLVMIVVIVERDVSDDCQSSCVKSYLEKQSTKVLQELEDYILNHGVIKTPTDDFAYEPKAIVHETKEKECSYGFAMDKEFCLPCKPGSFYLKQKCELCPLDTYNPRFGAKECYACLENRETFIEGATSSRDCIKRNDVVTKAAISILLTLMFVIFLIGHYLKRLCDEKKTTSVEPVAKPENNDSSDADFWYKSKSAANYSEGSSEEEPSSTKVSVNCMSSSNGKRSSSKFNRKFQPPKSKPKSFHEISPEPSNLPTLLVDTSAGDSSHLINEEKAKNCSDAWTNTEKESLLQTSLVLKQRPLENIARDENTWTNNQNEENTVRPIINVKPGYVRQHAALLGKNLDQMKDRDSWSDALNITNRNDSHLLPPPFGRYDSNLVHGDSKPAMRTSKSESFSTNRQVHPGRNVPKFSSDGVFQEIHPVDYKKVLPYLIRPSIV